MEAAQLSEENAQLASLLANGKPSTMDVEKYPGQTYGDRLAAQTLHEITLERHAKPTGKKIEPKPKKAPPKLE